MQETQRELVEGKALIDDFVKNIKKQMDEKPRQRDPLSDKLAGVAVHIADIAATRFEGELLQKGFAVAAAIADLGSAYEQHVSGEVDD